MLLENVAISRLDPLIVILDRLDYLEFEFLVEVYGLFVARLHVQVDLFNISLLCRFNGKFKQLAACVADKSKIEQIALD
jgi:hypothetical protein